MARAATGAGRTAGRRTWRGMPPGERDALRRERLLGAGLQLFGTLGYRATTVQGICQEAGVSTRSFYELFESREALLEAVYVEATREIVEGLAAIRVESGRSGGARDAGDAGDARDAGDASEMGGIVLACVRASIGPMLADERLGRVVEVEAVGVSESLERCRRSTNLAIARAIDDVLLSLMSARMVPDFPTGLIGIVIVGGVTEALVAHINSPVRQRRSSEAFIEEVARVVGRLVSSGG